MSASRKQETGHGPKVARLRCKMPCCGTCRRRTWMPRKRSWAGPWSGEGYSTSSRASCGTKASTARSTARSGGPWWGCGVGPKRWPDEQEAQTRRPRRMSRMRRQLSSKSDPCTEGAVVQPLSPASPSRQDRRKVSHPRTVSQPLPPLQPFSSFQPRSCLVVTMPHRLDLLFLLIANNFIIMMRLKPYETVAMPEVAKPDDLHWPQILQIMMIVFC